MMTDGSFLESAAGTSPPSGATATDPPSAVAVAYTPPLALFPSAPAHARSGRSAALCRSRPALPYYRGRWAVGPVAHPLPHSHVPQRGVLQTAMVASGGGGAAPRPRPRRSAVDKAAFWEAVEARVGASTPGLARFCAFAETARGERPRPPRHTLPPTYRPGREFYPGLPPPVPVVDTAGMAWVGALAAATPAIQAELAAVTGDAGGCGGAGAGTDSGPRRSRTNGGGGQQPHPAGATYRPHEAVHLGGWSALQLRWEGVQPPSSPLPRMPATAAAVAGAPLAPRSLAFAQQAPGTGISAHSDGLNFILTAHLGCTIPAPAGAAWIAIGEQRVAWTEGGVVLLDTAFVHKTWNGAATPRVVLVADVWHPDLSAAEVTALEALYACHAERNAAEAAAAAAAVAAEDAAASAATGNTARSTTARAAAIAATAGGPSGGGGSGGVSGRGGGGAARAWWALPWRRG